MKKPRENKSRRKIRRHRQLQGQRQRKASRDERGYVPAGFTFGVFLKNHKVEIFFLVLLVAGVIGIVLLGPDKGVIDEMRASVSSVIEEKAQYWDEDYPDGYKVIALTDKDIVHTSFDTLPEDLEINWKKLSVTRIQAKQFGSVEEKIKIRMTGIHYPPAGVSGLEIMTTLIRKEGAAAVLTRFNDLEFVAKIVGDNGEQVYCLLGLRQR